jgi:predicted acyl esterase
VPWYSGWRAALCLGRAGELSGPGVRRTAPPPACGAVERDMVIPAGDGVPLLANRFYPAGIYQPPLILLRSPIRPRRGAGSDATPVGRTRLPGAVCEPARTDGSGGEFDGFTNSPADADGTLSWLPVQPWFGGVLATWGASYLGFVQWELAARDIPEWKIAVIQDAPSEFADQFMYPGGGFALGNALG